MMRTLAGMAALWAASVADALWPVCVALPGDFAVAGQPALSARTERDVDVKVFQLRAGQRYQCKTRIARAFFF